MLEMPLAQIRSPHVIEKARQPGMVSGLEDAVGRATPLRGRVAAPRASSTSRVLGCVWIVAKVHLAKILVKTKRLVFVWMVAIFFGMPMNSSQLKFIFLANVGQIM